MARTIYEGFRYYSGPTPALTKVRARDGKTWKSGQPMYIDSGLWEPVVTDGTNVFGLASSDQDTATSSSDVFVDVINSTQTRFCGYVSSDTDDATALRDYNGTQYGIHVGSANDPSVNINETSNVSVVVRNPLWVEEPYMNDSTDSPGQVVFSFIASALE